MLSQFQFKTIILGVFPNRGFPVPYGSRTRGSQQTQQINVQNHDDDPLIFFDDPSDHILEMHRKIQCSTGIIIPDSKSYQIRNSYSQSSASFFNKQSDQRGRKDPNGKLFVTHFKGMKNRIIEALRYLPPDRLVLAPTCEFAYVDITAATENYRALRQARDAALLEYDNSYKRRASKHITSVQEKGRAVTDSLTRPEARKYLLGAGVLGIVIGAAYWWSRGKK